AVSLSRDGRAVALARNGDEGRDRVEVWDTSTGLLSTLVSTSEENITALEFSPDGRSLAAACLRGVVCWDLTKDRQGVRVGDHSVGMILSLAFAPNSDILATGDLLWKVRLWDVVNSKELAVLDGHCFP